MEGISSNAAKLVSISRRPGSIPGYESAGTSELADVVNNKLIDFVRLEVKDWTTYQRYLKKTCNIEL